MIGLGAGMTAAGVIVGGILAVLYGRKGSVSVTATVHESAYGYVVAARPCMKAVGLFRVKFKNDDGVTVRMTEMYVAGGTLKEGRFWQGSGAFGQQYADAGEELVTSVVFAPVTAAPSVVGWLIYLQVAATTRLFKFRTGWWADQYFVARPEKRGGTVSVGRLTVRWRRHI